MLSLLRLACRSARYLSRGAVAALLFAVSGCITVTPPPSPAPAPAPTAPAPAATVPAPSTPVRVTPDRSSVRIEPVAATQLPPVADADMVGAWPAWLASCRVLARRPDEAWARVCAAALRVNGRDAGAIRSYFGTYFDPWAVAPVDGAGTQQRGRLTGYYEPELTGSRVRRGPYDVPLARVPADLLPIELGAALPEAHGTRLRGRLIEDTTRADAARTEGQRRRVVPYWTREELTRDGRLAPLALVWVDDPIDAFFLQVQGSGRIRLVGGADDGKVIRLGFADSNGHPYRSIGRWLIERGELSLDAASMQGIQAWARANPNRLAELLNQNPSYVFFRELPLGDPALGPVGALNVPLVAGYSAAVDPAFTPLGAPLVIASAHPDTRAPLTRVLVAHDTGSAIRGPARVDLFWGTGRAAGETAGRSRDDVSVWMLLPKGVLPAAAAAQ